MNFMPMTIDFIILIFSFVSIILSIYVLVELSRFSNGFSLNHKQLSLFQEGLENRFRSLDSGSRQDFQALKFTLESRLMAMQEDNNLKLEETLNIDHKRRLVMCRFKKKRYLILLGQQDILIDVITEE